MLRLATLLAAVFAATPIVLCAESGAITSFRLSNGMEVVVVEDHRAPVVQHMVWYRAGSADEPSGQSGVAHFLEHLLFKATDILDSGAFSALVAANGGRDNAFTSYDYTAYFQRVGADRLGLMMEMEASRMRGSRFTPQDVEIERGVILEERNQRIETNPSALLGEQMTAALYLNHGYGTPIIGWRHEMERLSHAETRAFYDRHYHPNNAILVVTGDVTPQEVRALAETHYGAIPAKPNLPPRSRTAEPLPRAERRVILRDARAQQPYLIRSYLAPERNSGAQDSAAALSLLAELLGGGATSFMTEKLQFETRKAVFTAVYYNGTTLDATWLSLVAVPAPGVDLATLETALDDTIAQFIEAGPDSKQIARIKRQLRAEEIYARDDVERIGNRYGRALAIGLNVEDVAAWPDILQTVTEADILAAAAQTFRREASVTGWLMPQDGAQAQEGGLQ